MVVYNDFKTLLLSVISCSEVAIAQILCKSLGEWSLCLQASTPRWFQPIIDSNRAVWSQWNQLGVYAWRRLNSPKLLHKIWAMEKPLTGWDESYSRALEEGTLDRPMGLELGREAGGMCGMKDSLGWRNEEERVRWERERCQRRENVGLVGKAASAILEQDMSKKVKARLRAGCLWPRGWIHATYYQNTVLSGYSDTLWNLNFSRTVAGIT